MKDGDKRVKRLMDEADALEKRAEELHKEAYRVRDAILQEKPLLDRLVFAAYSRCPCGAGLAYDPASEDPDSPFKGPSCWDCSAIILGTAIPKGEPGWVQHTAKLPFAFYEVKSEDQPSANGATTRPRDAETEPATNEV